MLRSCDWMSSCQSRSRSKLHVKCTDGDHTLWGTCALFFFSPILPVHWVTTFKFMSCYSTRSASLFLTFLFLDFPFGLLAFFCRQVSLSVNQLLLCFCCFKSLYNTPPQIFSSIQVFPHWFDCPLTSPKALSLTHSHAQLTLISFITWHQQPPTYWNVRTR